MGELQTRVVVAIGLVAASTVALTGMVVAYCIRGEVPPALAAAAGSAIGAMAGHLGAMGWRAHNGDQHPPINVPAWPPRADPRPPEVTSGKP